MCVLIKQQLRNHDPYSNANKLNAMRADVDKNFDKYIL